MADFEAKITKKDVDNVSKNIERIYERRIAIAYALAQSFSIKILNEFRQRQKGNEFWTNQTQQAFQRVFSSAFRGEDFVGFFIAHGVDSCSSH